MAAHPKPAPLDAAKERRRRRRERALANPEKYCHSPFMKTCMREAKRWGMCHTHALEFMDKAWSRRIRTHGYCQVQRLHQKYGLAECAGRLSACHAVNRDYMHTRWDLRNGAEGCASFNNWSEHHPLEAKAIWQEFLGMDVYEKLEDLAMRGARSLDPPVDWDQWRRYLEAS